MMGTVYTRTYDAPPIDTDEIMRYAGVRGAGDEISRLLDSCLAELSDRLSFKVCYSTFPIKKVADITDMGFASIETERLGGFLDGCEELILFAATVGIEMDRMIARASSRSASSALLFQAIGTERIESLCERFCEDMKEEKKGEGFDTRVRFSPGYGKLPLELQEDIFAALNCHKMIGLTLNASLLMSPSKSVTAIIGLKRNK